jgi:nitrogen fixation/metabolism regulation signal transduction histidine kinase
LTNEGDGVKGPRAANITRLQRELRDERDFFSAVMENLSALVLIMSADRVVERVNRTCLQACGKTVSELVGKPLASILPELDACLSQAPHPSSARSNGMGWSSPGAPATWVSG